MPVIAALAAAATTVGTAASAISGAGALVDALKDKPDAPTAPAAEKPPAAAKTPERGMLKKKTKESTSASAPSGTLLTGPAGVQLDASILGKNTLLGG